MHGPGIAVGPAKPPQPLGRGCHPAGRTPFAEPQGARESVHQVHRARRIALADRAAGKQLLRQAIPSLLHALPYGRLRTSPLQQAFDPSRNQEQGAEVVDLAQAQDRRIGQLVAQVLLHFDHEAGDEIQGDGVSQAGKIAVALEAQGVEGVAVPGRHLVAAHGLQQFVAFRNVVREGATCAVGQAHLLDQLLPQGIIGLARQMVEPVVIAHHVMGADCYRLIVGIRGRPRRAEHRRNGNFAVRGQGPKRGERILVLGQYVVGNLGDLIHHARRLRIVPGASTARHVPAAGVQQIQDVAQQHQVDAFDGAVGAVAPPGGGDRQFLEPISEKGKGLRRKRLSRRAVIQMQVAKYYKHRTHQFVTCVVIGPGMDRN